MKNTEGVLKLAISSVIAAGVLSLGGSSLAAEPGKEQCAGIIKAGKNDCATKSNACHGHVKVDRSPDAWIYVPKGTCERIAGARLVEVVDPTPSKS